MARYGSILLVLFIPVHLLAQPFTPNPDWRFENFNSQNHFISRSILNLTIDKHGYIWTCSRGVQRFDGYRTIDYNSFDRRKGSLRSNYADVATDNEGRVWVSSSGLCYYDEAGSKFIYVETGAGRTITFTQGFCFQKNYLWFVCNYGLAKLDTHSLKISFTSLTDITDPLAINLMDENNLLITSREKIYAYNIEKNTYQTNTLTYDHLSLKVYAVTKKGPTTFLGTSAGLFTLNNFKDVTLLSKGENDLIIADLLFLPGDKEKKYLFLATDGKGLLAYNTFLKKIEYSYGHDDNNPFSLPSNIILKLFCDKTGRLWISTALGISMLDVNNQQLKVRFLKKDNTDGLNINKVTRDKYDSTRVWMSCYTRGMICMDWKTKQIEKIFNLNPELLKIYDFAQISKARWLLVTQKEIIEWAPQTGILVKKKLPVPDSVALLYYIRRIIMTDANTCFITTNKGLFKYDLARHEVSVVSENTTSKKIDDQLKYNLQNGLYDNGVLWIASRNGLFSYDVKTKQTQIYRSPGEAPDYFLFDVSVAANNQVVCAAGYGITIFNKQTKNFNVVNSIANLYKPDCENVICLKNTVWISSEAGILNYNLVTHRSSIAEPDIASMQFFPGSPFTVIGNEIVFGFSNGYASVTTDLKKSPAPSAPVIESVFVNNQPVLAENDNVTSDRKLVFNHSDNSINIAFTAFLYTGPDQINFRYLLKGANSKWQYAHDQRSANYAQLEPGDYTFYVQSGDKNGKWNNHLAAFSFIINPPYWETWWFRTLVILIIAITLYRLYKYRIKNILAIQKIRERIASDFHDDIGTALSSISIFSEVADTQLEEEMPREQTREIIGHISFQSRAMLDAMDDIIWAVNPQNDHFYDLAVRMREFAIPLLEARNIQFDIDIQEEILNTRIKMEARKNIFLIFKESINNILKHAGCTALKVSVKKLNDQLEVIISDNGKGFDIGAPSTRNGLKNMQKRAGEINGTLQVTTQPGKGTVTRLLVNTI